MYFLDDLIKAREKCKRAENDSEIATTDIEEPKTRKRKRKIRPVQSDDDSDGDDYISITYPAAPLLQPLHKSGMLKNK